MKIPDFPEERTESIEEEYVPASMPKGGRKNGPYKFIGALFAMLFLGLAGWVIYFNAVVSESFINSPYNTRQDTFADRVIRGPIISSDGQVLARTDVDEYGTETRVYPYSELFAHVVGYDSNGKSGLESEANFDLLTSREFFVDQLVNEFKDRKNIGASVISSLNTTLQMTAYSALGDRRGAVIAMEPKTGRILAMVSKPDFDPNTIAESWDYMIQDENDSSLLNRAVAGAYPPGSVFKIVTALDYYRKHGSFSGFSFLCEGRITMMGHTIHCYNETVHGSEDLYSAFANSCNCAFAQAGVDLGGSSLRKTAEDLLFNQELPFTQYRSSTFTLDADSGIPLIMQTSIGQGNTLVSPAHMALIVCAVANGGTIMKPQLIDEIQNSQGDVVRTVKPAEWKTIMTQDEAQALSALMQGVVENGTAYGLSGRGYTAAGKTGSAEFDEEGSSHSWFVGYSNVSSPDLVVAVIVEDGGTGSESAVPAAAAVFDAYYSTFDTSG